MLVSHNEKFQSCTIHSPLFRIPNSQQSTELSQRKITFPSFPAADPQAEQTIYRAHPGFASSPPLLCAGYSVGAGMNFQRPREPSRMGRRGSYQAEWGAIGRQNTDPDSLWTQNHLSSVGSQGIEN